LCNVWSNESNHAAIIITSISIICDNTRLPNSEISDENLLELIYLGDNAGQRMHEFAQGNSENVLLAACTVGRIGATTACSNAKQNVEGYNYFVTDDDDGSITSGTPTYYKNRFCKPSIQKSKIDHPHAITIFRLNSNNLNTAQSLLEAFRENHATNMQWASETQIGAEGHMLAKIVPCNQISSKFTNPSRMYPKLDNGNSVCDYVVGNGKQFAQEALLEWENLCSVWPRNEDGSLPKCHSRRTATWNVGLMFAGLVASMVLFMFFYKRKMKRDGVPSVDDSHFMTELT